jgi:hypothetical protein
MKSLGGIMSEQQPVDAWVDWIHWVHPYDPRRVEGAAVAEDEHGRLIETADCGRRCPGCGVCCAGYRDVVTADYFGIEEFEGNLRFGCGGLIRLEQNLWYRVPQCGPSCPGYGRCCKPFDLRQRPETVADAHRILLEDETSQRWQMQEALLILAHEGEREAVAVLEAFMPRAHTRVAGFAECALDEGRFFATVPRNAEEAQQMKKREILDRWEERAVDAYGKIEELESELGNRRYEAEIAQRLLDKAKDQSARETWQTQVDVLQMLVHMTESDLEEQREELALCEAMVAEMEADQGISLLDEFRNPDGAETPF